MVAGKWRIVSARNASVHEGLLNLPLAEGGQCYAVVDLGELPEWTECLTLDFSTDYLWPEYPPTSLPVAYTVASVGIAEYAGGEWRFHTLHNGLSPISVPWSRHTDYSASDGHTYMLLIPSTEAPPFWCAFGYPRVRCH